MSLLPYYDTYKCEGFGEEEKGHLVFLHGWGMNSLVWDDLIPLLIKEYQITLIDLPGMGRSPLPAGDYTLQTLSEQVLSVAPEKAVWVGWSLGALVLQNIALLHPEKIEKAVLISGTPKFVASEDWPNAMPLKVFEKFQTLLEEDWQGTLIRFLTLQCKGSESIKEDTRKLREYLFHYGLPATKALREGLNILKANDFREALKKLKPECHFILGEYDTLIPAIVESDFADFGVPPVNIHVIKGASHTPHISHPEKLSKIMRSVLQGVNQ
jgi:pimeloyl-[acyl-carrier protein] methyl ester esterase